MMVLIVLAAFGALFSVLLGYALDLESRIETQQAQMDAYYVSAASQALRMRLVRSGGLGTVTLANLQSTDEGFATKGINPERMFLASASNVSDGVWQFDRALVYAISNDTDVAWDPLLAASNNCAATGFATAASWCNDADGVMYSLIETRENYLQLLTEEGLRMQATLQKLGRGYSVVEPDRFPRGTLIATQAGQICTIGGGACVAATCTGPVMLQQTPLDCGDQFSRWGTPVVLNYLTDKHVALVTNANTVRRSAGTTRRIARELRVP